MAAGALIIGITQPRISSSHKAVKQKTDVYVLPPPKQLVVLSMGYRSALADILWSHVLVAQGLRSREKRRFDTLTQLLDAIIELDPDFRRHYLVADSLITFQASETPWHEVVKAREILELGTRNHPYDAEMWLLLGQFVAFLVPASFIDDDEIRMQWRMEGSAYLARAAELGGDKKNIGWGALGGASILTRAGEREAAIQFLERSLAVTEDEELREKIAIRLERLLTEEQRAEYDRRRNRFRAIWMDHTPSAKRTMVHLLSPHRDPAWCAGWAHRDDSRCAETWTDWGKRVESSPPRRP